MKIESSQTSYTQQTTSIPTVFTKKLSADEAKDIKDQITQNLQSITLGITSTQSSLASGNLAFSDQSEEFQSFLKEIGYTGKDISSLSQEEASSLVSEDGFFGISQTAQRITDFITNAANGDAELLKAGREGILQGFKMAGEAWGQELPQIAQDTMSKTLELVDSLFAKEGISLLDTQA